eukprot:jgi/Bigna1/141811/aug1.65_g16519
MASSISCWWVLAGMLLLQNRALAVTTPDYIKSGSKAYTLVGGEEAITYKQIRYGPNCMQYVLEFKLMPTGTHSSWRGIIHITNNQNSGHYPQVLMYPNSRRFRVCQTDAAKSHQCYTYPSNLPQNQWSRIKIRADYNRLRTYVNDGLVNTMTINNFWPNSAGA